MTLNISNLVQDDQRLSQCFGIVALRSPKHTGHSLLRVLVQAAEGVWLHSEQLLCGDGIQLVLLAVYHEVHGAFICSMSI